MKIIVLLGVCALAVQLTSAQHYGRGHYPQNIVAAPSHCTPEGIYTFPHDKSCDQYYLCTNGTFTHEFCPNGLLYSETGHVHGACAYYWNVDCKGKTVPPPISTPGCPYQFGFFSEDEGHSCNIYYSECAWGIPERKECHPKGLLYDERIKGCNWPDKLGCSSENIIGFKCPHEDTHNQYYPYPRYFYNNHAIVTCVKDQPRLIHCSHDELVDGHSLTCQKIYKEERGPH